MYDGTNALELSVAFFVVMINTMMNICFMYVVFLPAICATELLVRKHT